MKTKASEHVTVMPSLHHRHERDQTVLSYLVGGVNRIGDKSKLYATDNFEIEHV